jgi:hypothetical protein
MRGMLRNEVYVGRRIKNYLRAGNVRSRLRAFFSVNLVVVICYHHLYD